MELRTFITQVLVDIVEGITDAQGKLTPGTVVPGDLRDDQLRVIEKKLTPYQVIEFEACIRIDETQGKEAKIGVISGFINGGASGNSETEKGHSTTVKFAVPVRFPVQTQ